MDELYIKKVLDGDIDAFRYFVHQYKDKAYNLAFSILKNEFDARDAVQEAYIIAFRKMGKFRGKSKFSTWLFRIVINEALKSSKKTGEEKYITDTRTGSVDPGNVEINDTISRDQQKYYIDLAMQNIPSKEALALTLFYMEEYSIEEIREITGWTESNVKVLLHRARKSMYNELNVLLSTEKETLY
jgi:RNA polymerase sigma factor (sigma-70 family)